MSGNALKQKCNLQKHQWLRYPFEGGAPEPVQAACPGAAGGTQRGFQLNEILGASACLVLHLAQNQA